MKITGVKTTLYQHVEQSGADDAESLAKKNGATSCLVELSTDEDLAGIGICGTGARTWVEELVKDVLVGENPAGVTGLWQRMGDSRREQRGLINEAISVLDVALWDLKAKYNNEPLWKTLGGARPWANIYASIAGPMPDKELSRWYARMAVEYGIREGKLKVGLDLETDLRRLGLMREALQKASTEPVLMIDADECWSPKQAVRMVREMEPEFDLTWVEAPVRYWDFPGMKRVSDNIRAAVCNSKYLDHAGDFLPHFYHRSMDIVQLDTAHGGITGVLQLADAAYGFELPVTLCASPGNFHAHLAGAMPYFMSMEVTDPLATEGILTTDVRIEEGRAVAGDRAGNGLVIDYDALAAVGKCPEK